MFRLFLLLMQDIISARLDPCIIIKFHLGLDSEDGFINFN